MDTIFFVGLLYVTYKLACLEKLLTRYIIYYPGTDNFTDIILDDFPYLCIVFDDEENESCIYSLFGPKLDIYPHPTLSNHWHVDVWGKTLTWRRITLETNERYTIIDHHIIN
jgi:hypothetical protein